MPSIIDLTGHRFGKLVAMRRAPNKGAFTRWECICDCGKMIVTFSNGLRSGHAKSCGCLKSYLSKERALRHGMYRTKTYSSWRAMLSRCRNRKDVSFPYYGGRGIKVCDRWKSFDNFFEDMGERPTNTTIDRLSSDGNYEPGNCRWATREEQDANKPYRGTKRPNAYKRVRQLSLDGTTIAEFVSVLAASSATGVASGSISTVCLGRRKTAGNFKWTHA